MPTGIRNGGRKKSQKKVVDKGEKGRFQNRRVTFENRELTE